MQLFDSHCHLQDERIYADIDGIIKRAAESGVAAYLCNGSCAGDWQAVYQIFRNRSNVFPAFGLHPWYVDGAPADWFQQLEHYLESTPSIVGEIGLDLMFKKKSKIENQETAFRKQMELAARLKRPVSIHCLKAWHILQPILKEYSDAGIPIQLHSYNGGPGPVDALVELGCYFSFSGSLTRTRNKKAHQSIGIIPLERIMFETDAPDIPLEIDGHIDNSVPNEPANLGRVIGFAAQLLNMDEEELARQVWENTVTFLEPAGIKPIEIQK